jgi:gliding motility-associated-like protein
MRKQLLLLTILLTTLSVSATHIVGGYISYRFLSGITYEVTLTIYRDCNSATPFDGQPNATTPAVVGLFQANSGVLIQTFELFDPVVTVIQPPLDNPCLIPPGNVCVEQGVYLTTITLPSATEPFTLVHERCCRNGTISNVFNPGDQGAVYSATIPPTNPYQNSSPTFNSFPPLFICVNSPIQINNSATDIDGDVLTYSLCTPSNGGTSTDPAPNPPFGPPYNSIPWEAGYSTANLLGGNPALAIDPSTGILTGTPNTIGQFVVGVCVSEFRNGVLLGTYLRDFQFNVTQCNIPIAAIPSSNINPQTGIGIYTINCKSFTTTFQNNTFNPPPTNVPLSFEWDFGVPGISTDTSSLATPTYTFPDSGTYLVRLIVIKSIGNQLCSDTAFALVKLYPVFTTNFNAPDVCKSQTASFSDLSTTSYGNINFWNWNFGDGNTSTAQNPQNAYANSGTFPVQLISGNIFGCRDTLTKNITIFDSPDANFSVGLTCVNTPVNITNSSTGPINTTIWNFGNGSTSTLSAPTPLTYNAVGPYTISLVLTSANGCADTASQNITINPNPNVTNNDTAICLGQSVQFQGSGGTSYTWSPATFLNDPTLPSPIATPTNSTVYTVSATNQFQCTASDVVNVTIFPNPTVNAGLDTSVCLNPGSIRDSVRLQASGAQTYVWQPANSLNSAFTSSPVAKPTFNTTYFVIGTDANGCIGTDSVVVYVLDPTLNLIVDNNQNVCINDTVYADIINQGASNYSWNPTQFITDPTSYSPGFFPTVTTPYILSVSNYCYNKADTIFINVLPLPILSFSHVDSLCSNQSVVLQINGASTYVWSADSTLSTLLGANPTASPLINTTYSVTGTDANGCKNSASTTITIVPLPLVNAGYDTIIYRDTYGFLNGSTNAQNFLWSPDIYLSSDNVLNTRIEPTKTQQYVLTGISDFGCVNYDTVLIIVETNTILLIPTAFSPNGDGVNDVFRILRTLNIQKLLGFSVYNRWGEQVYSTNNIDDGWDGSFRNVEQELGVYVWTVEALTKDNEKVLRKGNVTLLR